MRKALLPEQQRYLESGERGERQPGGLSANGGSEPNESTERESKVRFKDFERPLRLQGRAAEIPIEKSPASAGDLLGSGGDLLSRAVTSQVPSALKGLTSVFGMGTGVTPSSLPPEMVQCVCAH